MSTEPVAPRAASRRTRDRRAQPGFTMLEMLIVVVLMGIVMGAMLVLLVRQQRFYTGAADLIEMRSNVRQALGVLPADLRAVSSVGGDIYSMGADEIEFRATFGSSVICSIPALGGSTIVLPPLSLARRGTLTSWMFQPSVGDSVFVYDEGRAVGTADDSWRRFRINAIATAVGAGACPAAVGTGPGFVQAADALEPSFQLVLSSNLDNTVIVGAPVRLFRRVHYSLYQAADSKWYLGWRDCLHGRSPPCSQVQAISGPYEAASATPGQGGLGFAYFDSTGAATNNRAAVARVDIVVRGQSQLRADGSYGPQSRRDSLSMVVGLRNRS